MQARPINAGTVDTDDQDDDPCDAAVSRLKMSYGFLDLPAEIRNAVYGLICDPITVERTAIPASGGLCEVYIDEKTPLRLPPIIHTCRRIRLEVLSLWLPMHHITTNFLAGALRWIDTPDPQFTSFIGGFSMMDWRDAHREGTWEEPVRTGRRLCSRNRAIFMKFYYGIESEENGDGSFVSMSFDLNSETHVQLDRQSKELIKSTIRTGFQQKSPITFDKFVLVVQQLAQIPLKIIRSEGPRYPHYCNYFSISLVAGSEDREYNVLSGEPSEHDTQQE